MPELIIAEKPSAALKLATALADGKIDKKIINNGNIGPVTLRVKTYFEEIVKGERKAYKKWLTYVQ